MPRFLIAALCLVVLAACDDVVVATAPGTEPASVTAPAPQSVDELVTRKQSLQAFSRAVARVEPVAERECRRRTNGVDCDFKVLVDDRPRQPANAYQTLDENDRPIIAFTVALIDDARNEDELAFVLSHEAAHHIRGHIARQRQNAAAGAVVFAGLAKATGAGEAALEEAVRLGATVGARSYSKEFELEADALGTAITHDSGYDPLRGAEFFNRIPDPGNRFLGTHPPNAKRIATVRRVAAGL